MRGRELRDEGLCSESAFRLSLSLASPNPDGSGLLTSSNEELCCFEANVLRRCCRVRSKHYWVLGTLINSHIFSAFYLQVQEARV